MNEVHFTNCIAIIAEEQRQLTAAKIAKTKTENSINEIKNAIAQLQSEDIKITQANVIRRLTGKRCKKTIIQHWKTLFPKHSSEDTVYDLPDHANQKPLNQWTNTELGVPTLEQERNYYPDKNVNLLIYHLQCMRQFRIQELQRVGRY
jgi:hypothetical protein